LNFLQIFWVFFDLATFWPFLKKLAIFSNLLVTLHPSLIFANNSPGYPSGGTYGTAL